ncbi:VOC family protein [Marinoscillum pacificum]|uniref:VOC family protein n=1 Tax=Marinoscillum pacificum TaxID=392723 RepID=UPI00215814B8|nr:VOC family protein [Marinoscillum pacificum]
MSKLQTPIIPCLWFDNQAKEAAEFYCSIFPNSKITSSSPLIASFELDGNSFVALNGGPKFKFSEAISFQILCDDQQEVDFYWNAFTQNGGEESMCSWCKDKYGLSWQVIPKRFLELMSSGNSFQVQRVTETMLKMKKLIIADLEAAYNS